MQQTSSIARLQTLSPFADLPIGWQIAFVALGAVAVAVILLTVVFVVPDLWRAGRAWVEDVLAPDPSAGANVVDIETRRRRELRAAVQLKGGR